jgi:HD superfamily phosphohydrolase
MICEICDKVLKDRYYKRHKDIFHCENPIYIKCPHCSKEFRDMYLNRHIRYSHTDPEFKKKTDERTKKYAKENREKVNINGNRWKKNNPEKKKECDKNYRSRPEVRERLDKWYKTRVKCEKCNKEMNRQSLSRHKIVCGNIKIKKTNNKVKKIKENTKIVKKLSEIDKLRIRIANAEMKKNIKRNLMVKENVILEF